MKKMYQTVLICNPEVLAREILVRVMLADADIPTTQIRLATESGVILYDQLVSPWQKVSAVERVTQDNARKFGERLALIQTRLERSLLPKDEIILCDGPFELFPYTNDVVNYDEPSFLLSHENGVASYRLYNERNSTPIRSAGILPISRDVYSGSRTGLGFVRHAAQDGTQTGITPVLLVPDYSQETFINLINLYLGHTPVKGLPLDTGTMIRYDVQERDILIRAGRELVNIINLVCKDWITVNADQHIFNIVGVQRYNSDYCLEDEMEYRSFDFGYLEIGPFKDIAKLIIYSRFISAEAKESVLDSYARAFWKNKYNRYISDNELEQFYIGAEAMIALYSLCFFNRNSELFSQEDSVRYTSPGIACSALHKLTNLGSRAFLECHGINFDSLEGVCAIMEKYAHEIDVVCDTELRSLGYGRGYLSECISGYFLTHPAFTGSCLVSALSSADTRIGSMSEC